MLTSTFEDTTCPKVEFCQGNLLLSPQAYRELLNGASSSKVNLDWELVKCPENFVRGGVELAFGEAVNAKTLALQVRNFYGKIEGVDAKFEDGKTYVFQTMGDGSTGRARLQVGLPVDTTHAFTEPFTLVVKQSDKNDTIEVKFDHLPQPNEVVVTDAQFD
ncbi:hypothetical protein Poli38472_005929 [Pythium oligandrum]|uniref:Uncharacterized protein n=1 Tax=Pythium oligandrum TaxID=41045 RepID=A0A8K1FMP4_PYTOL|nr:hypothetical protein Poli38472_005929 [Pythium oligandrum]|eukprot:TMW68461.1 hypothetical protein Poli38472_005929 [Pythium oligandrum]